MPGEIMAKIAAKGGVTLPKSVRDAVGLKPGDVVDVQATSSGGVYIEKPGAAKRYRERVRALVKRRPIRDITTDELMEFSRGELPSGTANRRKPGGDK
jgi:antitoxin PrlF